MERKKYTMEMFTSDISILVNRIRNRREERLADYDGVYGVPRGGVPLAAALSQRLLWKLTEEPTCNTLIVDDVVDSGKTRLRFRENDFASIHIKEVTPPENYPTIWLHKEDCFIDYPWEVGETTIEDHITRMLEYIGEDPSRSGMRDTPDRVVKSWGELFEGYRQDPEKLIKTFRDDRVQFGGLVYLKDIEFYSTCEHHWLPFHGTAFIAYIPNGPVIGASKLGRILDLYARRFQMQERIGEQVTNALMRYLDPLGAACLTEARHLCIACRGIKQQRSIMGYSSMKGVFLESSERGVAARNELMMLWGR